MLYFRIITKKPGFQPHCSRDRQTLTTLENAALRLRAVNAVLKIVAFQEPPRGYHRTPQHRIAHGRDAAFRRGRGGLFAHA
jgi:hypothetical protein